MKKILVSDYDQTFYLNDQDIEINKKEVENFKKYGNIFIIATGRSFLDFKNKVNAYDINYDYVILNHGATVLDKYDNIIFNFPICNEVIKNIKKDVFLEECIKKAKAKNIEDYRVIDIFEDKHKLEDKKIISLIINEIKGLN